MSNLQLILLLDAFSLVCAIQIESAYISIVAASWQITSTAQLIQLDCRENWIDDHRIH